MAYGVVRTDNMSATKDGSQIKSAKFYAGASNGVQTAIENGNIVAFTNTMVAGEREIQKVITPAATNTVAQIGLVCSVEVMPDERMHNLNEFTNAAGATLRVFKLHNGDIFSVTADALDTTVTPVAGSTSVVIGASTKMIVKTTSSLNSEKVIGSIIATETIGNTTYWTIQVNY